MLSSKSNSQPRKLWHPWDLSDSEEEEEEKAGEEKTAEKRSDSLRNNNAAAEKKTNAATGSNKKSPPAETSPVQIYPILSPQSLLSSAAAVRFMGFPPQQSFLHANLPFPNPAQGRGAGIMVRNPIVAAVLGDQQQADPLQVLQQNRCAHCGMMFRMTSDLVQHMRMHHQRRGGGLTSNRRSDEFRKEELGKRKGTRGEEKEVRPADKTARHNSPH